MSDLKYKLISEIVEKLKNQLKENICSIAVFGSFARNKDTKESDIDLFLVGNFTGSVAERIITISKLCSEIVNKYHVRVEFYPFTPQEVKSHPVIMLDMTEDAKILYDQGNFLENELKIMKERLNKIGAKRIFLDKDRWYWRLHPKGKPVEI